MKLIFRTVLTIAFFTFIAANISGNNNSNLTLIDSDPAENISGSKKAFFENLSQLCGKSFEGKQIYMSPEGENDWENKTLIINVAVCEDNYIHIPFYVDEDKSRTWMLTIDAYGLSLRHDHKDELGNPAEQNLYGGYAHQHGTEFRQDFLNDKYTQNMVDDGIFRTWVIEFSQDMKKLSYKLKFGDGLHFQADFDLENPL